VDAGHLKHRGKKKRHCKGTNQGTKNLRNKIATNSKMNLQTKKGKYGSPGYLNNNGEDLSRGGGDQSSRTTLKVVGARGRNTSLKIVITSREIAGTTLKEKYSEKKKAYNITVT